MSDPVVITLRGEPQGKGRARIGRMANGRPVAFTPAHTRSYEAALRVAASDAMEGRPPLEGALHVSMVATFPIPQSWSKKKRGRAIAGLLRPVVKPDVDNLLKTLDALNEVVWRDDRQIVQAQVQKRYGDEPGVTIVAREAA